MVRLQVMSAGALRNMRLDAQQQVMSVWGLAAYEARALLMTYNWNIEKLQGEARFRRGLETLGNSCSLCARRPHVPSHQRRQIQHVVVARELSTLPPAFRVLRSNALPANRIL
jgi:hypothetical protein